MFLKAAKGCKLGDFSSVAQSCLTLRPHGLQHTRPPCPSPTPRVYSALTYSIPDLEPVCCSKSSSNCCFLICIQITHEAGQVAWYSHLFQNFPQFVVIHIVKNIKNVLLQGSSFIYKALVRSSTLCSSEDFHPSPLLV